MMILLCICIIYSLLINLSECSQYCATITAEEAGDATGYFAVDIVDGVGYYYFDLNLDNFDSADASDCDFTTYGLKYHIHSYWTNPNTTSSAGSTYCGAPYTGGHYDPTFACSTSSQNYTTACTTLGRIPSDGYTYTCTPEIYSDGDYASCELGDLSGKFGIVYPTEGTVQFSTSDPLVDTNPPYEVSYETNVKNSLKWSSIVFHCGTSAAPRLVCAELSTVDLNACLTAFEAVDALIESEISSTDDGESSELTYNDYSGAIAVSVVVSLVVGTVFGIIIMRFLGNRGSNERLLK
mmetsp:Transcript_3297/g.2934  ORF Transcript_3297/g.2934 Transcript_3297/m.2934 type:complete len:295 (-) Transcript_3297:33-917(-)